MTARAEVSLGEHDMLCPKHLQYPGHRSRCVCALLREADSRARADERARWVLGWTAAADNAQALAHAETVAARLVEGWCSEVEDVEGLHRIIGHLDAAHDLACEQRDAAREDLSAARSGYASMLVEAGQKVIDAHREVALARADVADAERIAALRLADMAAQTVVTRGGDGTVSVRIDDPYGLGWTPVALALVNEWAATVNEHAALTRWKAEATAVIEAWEQVHRLLGSPGRVGESKAAATYDAVAALLAEARP